MSLEVSGGNGQNVKAGDVLPAGFDDVEQKILFSIESNPKEIEVGTESKKKA